MRIHASWAKFMSFMPTQVELTVCQLNFLSNSFCKPYADRLQSIFNFQLCDAESRETSWLILTETLRERNKLTDALKTMWEEEIKVEIMTDVWPTINLAL